ncbi:MAG: PfkB family carbohydrate kinase [Lawsonibacter sp.]
MAVATMGSRGAMAWDGREMAYHTPKLVQAVDTLGAGDSFAAGFLMRYLELKTSGACSKPYLRQCMEAGAELSAQTCMVHGAFGFGVPIE